MKPFAILLSIVIGIGCLSAFAVIFRPATKTSESAPAAATEEDLPLPKTGPYGKAEIDESVFEFGVRLVGTDEEHTFTIKNIGQGKLDFKLGKPTCQCTGVEVTKVGGGVIEEKEGSLAPGESINILLKWTMKAQMSKFRHGVKVFTTDPDMRTIDIAVEGKVENLFFFRPDSPWELGELTAVPPPSAEGTITSSHFDSFKVEEEPRDNPKVKITFSPLEESLLEQHGAKSGYKIRAEVGTDVPVGQFRESVKIKASNGEQEQIVEFTVTGRRAGPIEIRGVAPGATYNSKANRLIFLDFPAAQGKTAKLTLFVKGFDEDLVLQGVEPADTKFKVSLAEGKMLGKSKSYQLEVTVPPGPVGMHRANDAETVTLKFNHPEMPEFNMMIDYNAVR